jgi:hypothetical protein
MAREADLRLLRHPVGYAPTYPEPTDILEGYGFILEAVRSQEATHGLLCKKIHLSWTQELLFG